VEIQPLTPDRFTDLCTLFGRSGANSGCWCMWWRRTAKDWSAGAAADAREGPDGNRTAFAALVAGGEPTGLLAYRDGAPVGWCAVAPREAYVRLLRSTTIAPADPAEPDVWSVTCFFIRRDQRRAGVGHALLSAAVDFAASRGASVVEGYPVDNRGTKKVSGDLFTGTVSQFTHAGFAVDPRAPAGKRVVVRRAV
jgi:GNAT superfamily N-acetyltransferase